MQGHHYLVNDTRFKNYYAALRHSSEVNSFAKYVIPRTHLDAYESVNIQQTLDKSPDYFIKEKINWLFNNFKTQRLHYSGGSDSHTILKLANNMGYSFTDSLTALSSINKDAYVDEEYMPAIDYIKSNPGCVVNPEFFYPTIKDFEDLWSDPENFYKQSGAYFSFRPIYTDIIMQGRQERDCEVTGHFKPKLMRKNNHYYWILFSFDDEYMRFKNEISFFGDGQIPELAVQQAYICKMYFDQHVPCKDQTALETLTFSEVPETQREKFNGLLGRVPSMNESIAIGTILGKADALNEKNHRSMREILAHGRQDILNMWDNTRKQIIEELADIPHSIDLIPQKCAVDGYKQERMIPKRMNRIGFIYRLDPDKIVPIEHTELFS